MDELNQVKTNENWNVRLFFKINSLQGQNKWVNAFGYAGAELLIWAMGGWFIASTFIDKWPNKRLALWQLFFCLGVWLMGWLVDMGVGFIVREPRPHITFPNSKLLFTPMMSWKSFPSDHAMTAFLMVGLAFLFNLPGSEALVFLALWVSWGRVYAGVHYPFDIIGGFSVASLVTVVAYYLLIIFF